MARTKLKEKLAGCPLVEENVNQLNWTLSILNELTPHDYTRSDFYAGSSAIGSHVRHVLNHYDMWFLAQKCGVLNYEKRPRDIPAEKCLDAAKSWLSKLLHDLHQANIELSAVLEVVECGGNITVRSTVGRELAFLYSHTAHHLALIKQQAVALGYAFSDKIGVHPSTLRAQEKLSAQGKTCAR